MQPTRSRGVVLLEMMIAVIIFSLLLGVLAFSYRQGALAWKRAEAKSVVLSNLQLAMNEVCRHLERSIAGGVTMSGESVAILSALDDHGQLVYDSARESQEWQRFYLIYRDPVAEQLRRRNVPLATPSSDVTAFGEAFGYPVASALANPDTSERPMSLNVNITSFRVSPEGAFGGLLRVHLTAEKLYSSSERQSLELETLVRIRN